MYYFRWAISLFGIILVLIFIKARKNSMKKLLKPLKWAIGSIIGFLLILSYLDQYVLPESKTFTFDTPQRAYEYVHGPKAFLGTIYGKESALVFSSPEWGSVVKEMVIIGGDQVWSITKPKDAQFERLATYEGITIISVSHSNVQDRYLIVWIDNEPEKLTDIEINGNYARIEKPNVPNSSLVDTYMFCIDKDTKEVQLSVGGEIMLAVPLGAAMLAGG
ncbi:MAG: hypothetical protein LBN26_09225 [Christensenellaceae bacterium]|jgi:hypothetical protein|nr:hypothetical protein [Christensenellaceae bacterium]